MDRVALKRQFQSITPPTGFCKRLKWEQEQRNCNGERTSSSENESYYHVDDTSGSKHDGLFNEEPSFENHLSSKNDASPLGQKRHSNTVSPRMKQKILPEEYSPSRGKPFIMRNEIRIPILGAMSLCHPRASQQSTFQQEGRSHHSLEFSSDQRKVNRDFIEDAPLQSKSWRDYKISPLPVNKDDTHGECSRDPRIMSHPSNKDVYSNNPRIINDTLVHPQQSPIWSDGKIPPPPTNEEFMRAKFNIKPKRVPTYDCLLQSKDQNNSFSRSSFPTQEIDFSGNENKGRKVCNSQAETNNMHLSSSYFEGRNETMPRFNRFTSERPKSYELNRFVPYKLSKMDKCQENPRWEPSEFCGNLGSTKISLTSGEDHMKSKTKENISSKNGRVVETGKAKKSVETDPVALARRQKQIDYGKNTLSYENYLQKVPRNKRKHGDPVTPNKHGVYSRRSWDALVKIWRIKLHDYDDVKDSKNACKSNPGNATETSTGKDPQKKGDRKLDTRDDVEFIDLALDFD